MITFNHMKSVPVEKWEKEFDERYIKGDFGDVNETGNVVPLKAIKDFISQAIQAAKEEERTSHRVRVGILRQWLNEDRITDTSKMVTNEDIEYWLSIINKHQ